MTMMRAISAISNKKTKARKMPRISKGNHLSEREKEVMTLVANGRTAQEIADRLFLSINTVETHKRKVLKKIKAKNTAHAVAKAIRGELI